MAPNKNENRAAVVGIVYPAALSVIVPYPVPSAAALAVFWADKEKDILYVGLPGEAGGASICDLLFGRAVPCGKLAESWSIHYEDWSDPSVY